MGKPLQNENMSQHQNKRPRTADGNDYSTISSTNSPYPIATSPSGSTQPSTSNEAPVYPSVNSTNYFTEDQHILVNASLLEATKLFPRDLSDAIKRNPSPRNGDTLVAAISMTFPNTPSTKTQSTTVFESQIHAPRVPTRHYSFRFWPRTGHRNYNQYHVSGGCQAVPWLYRLCIYGGLTPGR